MMVSLFYVLVAVLGLSFLIFIHELGHYFMAKRVGMKVETFSIGFGKPILSWEKNGVQWRIGWLLFGGYVKIAGVDFEKDKDPFEVPGGFFSKPPFARVLVAVMGPVANIVFAIIAFTFLWSLGGREKNFSEFTTKIGWVDPASELYIKGVRPGDEILAYDHRTYHGAKDNLYAPMTSGSTILVSGNKVDYARDQKVPFEYSVPVYQHPSAMEKEIKTAGILQPASYVLYDILNGHENPLPEGSPLRGSGIQYGDRVFWVDGEIIYSVPQLNHVLNSNQALLTIERNGHTYLRRVPRVKVPEIKANSEFKEELRDWQFEADLQGIKTQNLYTIPYNITNDNIVENALSFIDKDREREIFHSIPYSYLEKPLMPGDKIVAIYGMPIQRAYELLENLQKYQANVIVQRNLDKSLIPYSEADILFDQQLDNENLQQIIHTIGTANPIFKSGHLYLLNPITPQMRNTFTLSPEKQAQLANELQEQKRAIESISDPERKNQQLRLFQEQEKKLLLGLPGIQDKKVEFNPSPVGLFRSVFDEIWRTLAALFSGALNPKWILGPIGIVQVVHDSTMTSLKEAIYWLGAISLNLGILNLLPIPVLDGGTIFMSLVEMGTGKRIHPKTLEKLVLPFAILLIGFFIFLTYHDLLRLFSNFIN